MLTSQDKRKIKGFQKWLRRNEDTNVLSLVADTMGQKGLVAVIKTLEAKGYPLDERGVPIILESDEDYEKLVFALYESFEEVTGADLVWGLFAPYLEDFREWLAAISELSEGRRWWNAVDWRKISLKTLGKIAQNMYKRGYVLDESGVPTGSGEVTDTERPWRDLGESILEALVEAASENGRRRR